MARRAANVSRASSLDCRIVFFFFPTKAFAWKKKQRQWSSKAVIQWARTAKARSARCKWWNGCQNKVFLKLLVWVGGCQRGKSQEGQETAKIQSHRQPRNYTPDLNAVMSIRKLAFLTEPQDGADLQNAEHCAVTPALFNSPLQYVLRAW